MKLRRYVPLIVLGGMLASACVAGPDGSATGIPSLSVSLGGNAGAGSKDGVASQIAILVMLGVLSFVPAIVLLLSPFTSIVITLSLARSALGIPTVPPTQVVVGLALFITYFVSEPTIAAIDRNAVQPFFRDEITLAQAQERAAGPVRELMLGRTRQGHLEVFLKHTGRPRPQTPDDVETAMLAPAFLVSEITTGMGMGLLLFLPMLLIDLVVAAVLNALGMIMVSPATVSLPIKLMVFVLLDGWGRIVAGILGSFPGF